MISLQHYQELRASGIHPDIIKLNFQTLSGEDALETLLYGELDHLAEKSPHSAQYTTVPLKRLFERFKHVSDGGWWCNGVDVLDQNQNSMAWGCFKPDTPRRNFEDPTKVIKYEHPGKTPTRAFFLVVSWEIGYKIAEEAGLGEDYLKRCPEDKDLWHDGDFGFWEWVRVSGCPIMITEGAKKAGAALSAGYACIGLPGITGGARTKNASGEKCAPYLIPELEIFQTPGRRVYVGFDYETKPKTLKNVQREINKLGELFIGDGRDVRVINLPGPEKGLDDFIVDKGEEAFDLLVQNAPEYRFHQFNRGWNLTYPIAERLDTKYLGQLNLPRAGFVGIKSAKGTGKTKSLEPVAQDAIAEGRKVLVITHRVELGRAICGAVGVNWIEDCKDSAEGKLFGYGLCIDSLHPLSQARFDPDDWEGAIVILDEVEQVLWHALNSSTCHEKRAVILRTFEQLIRVVLATGGLIIAQDADLSNYSLDYIKELSGYEELVPHIILNVYKGASRKVWFYKHKIEAIYSVIDQKVNEGKRVLIVEDSQKAKGRFSCINMESQLKKNHPDKRILRIDSETVGNSHHPAFACAKNINQVIELGQWDIVIASPTIGTGVSIDLRDYFDCVFGVFKGAIATNDVLQMMHRLRDPEAEWHLWTDLYGCAKVGNGSSGCYVLLDSKDRSTRKNLELLQKADRKGFSIDEQTDPRHTRAWAKYGARINAGQWGYRGNIWFLLTQEGHDIQLSEDSDLRDRDAILAAQGQFAQAVGDEEMIDNIEFERGKLEVIIDEKDATNKKIKVESEEIRTENRLNNAKFTSSREKITKTRYKELQDKKAKSPEEIAEQHKYYLEDTYKIDCTPELVLKDEDGWLRKIRLHYFLENKQKAYERDMNHLEAALENGEGLACLQDLSFYAARVEILELLGVQFFLSGEEFTNESPVVIRVADALQQAAREIKDHFKISTIRKGKNPMGVINKFLKDTIGATLTSRVIRENGSRTRAYSFKGFTDGRSEVFEAWDQIVSPDTNNGIISGSDLLYIEEKTSDPNPEKRSDPPSIDLVGGEITPDLEERAEEAIAIPVLATQETETLAAQVVEAVETTHAVTDSWKGAVRRVKTILPDCWLKVYELSTLGRNLLLEAAGKAFTIVDDAPMWRYNHLDPKGGDWVFNGRIEGSAENYQIPHECLEFGVG